MRRSARLGISGLLVLGVLTLAGCAPETYDSSTDGMWPVREINITLKDGRVLPCINIRQGLSCDWYTANGYDRPMEK